MDISPRKRRGPLIFAVVGLLVLLALAHALDRSVWSWLRPVDVAALERTERHDLYRLLRIVGYLPTWLLIALAVGLALPGTADRRLRAALAIGFSAALSGGLAEIAKLVIARERPGENGEYVFRGLFGGFSDSSNLGMPSSHAAVAFGAAFALFAAIPRVAPLVLLVATGCAATRVISGAHFVSDCAGSLLVGWLAARFVCAIVKPVAPSR